MWIKPWNYGTKRVTKRGLPTIFQGKSAINLEELRHETSAENPVCLHTCDYTHWFCDRG